MRISVPTEVKSSEARVALTPSGVHQLVEAGHEVTVQTGAGLGSHIGDEEYAEAGAVLVDDAAEVWASADMVLKVKEPLESEYGHLREDLTLFTYLHLAASEPLTRALLEAGTTSIAYETVQPDAGGLPLLAPMSEIAGRISAQIGAHHLLSPSGGRGVVLSGIPGVQRAKVSVIGAGVAGTSAARVAAGMGAAVDIIDINLSRLRQIDEVFGAGMQTIASNPYDIAASVRDADLVIGSVLIPGARAPKLVTDEMVAEMKPGSVLVDIAIDQGGCFEGSTPTTHDEPTYRVHDSIYYCVANIPGAAPTTATKGLTNATMPYVLKLANAGWKDAAKRDSALLRGLSTHGGELTHAGVGAAFDIEAVDPAKLVGA